jgi:23S rRNA (adenine2030-N6)-methyltransferase
VPKALSLSLAVGGDSPGLRETGLVIVNPPFTLRGEAETLLPFLAARMAAGAGAGYGVEQLTEA